MVAHYEQVIDGDEFFIETDQPLLLACCDCSCIHEILFKKVRKGIKITINRKPRNTASMRRHQKHEQK